MEIGTIAIPITFIILVALLLWYVIGAKGKWFTKFILILLIPTFSFAIWKSLDSYLGWPTITDTPKKFLIVWVGIKEPNKKTGDNGAIFILLKSYNVKEGQNSIYSILEYDHKPNEPRLHKLSYSRKLHEMMEKVIAMLKKGTPVIGEFNKDGHGKPGFMSGEKKSTAGSDKGSGYSGAGREQVFRFYSLPPPKFPNKNPEQIIE